MRTVSLLALATAILLSDASSAFAFGRRCGGCNGNGGGRPLLGRVFGPMRGECVGGCSQSAGQYPTFNSCCPPAGCPIQYVTPNCSGGVCSPNGMPVNFGFNQGCPGGVCPPARRR